MPHGDEVKDALRAMGMEGAVVGGGVRSGLTWRWPVCGEGGERFELVRYPGAWTGEPLEYGERLAALLHDRGWPIAERVAGGGADEFALYRAGAGEPDDRTSAARQRVRGRLLARFHADAARFDEREQRPCAGRAWELDVFVRPAADSFNALLAEFDREHHELAWALRRERYRNLRELARLGYGESPSTVIHGQFGGAGLRFEAGALAGVPGLERARRDSPVFDVAAAVAIGCGDTHDPDALDPALVRAFVEGYAAGARLSPEQSRLVLPLVRAAHLWDAMAALLAWRAGTGTGAVADLRRIGERALPALAARWAALSQAVEGVAR
ncbi:MAG: hypothetical protein IT302_09820 [Dehalococcoidia bacterium]|nr:hypothetical protein [Dehalococcoidia bacterium]